MSLRCSHLRSYHRPVAQRAARPVGRWGAVCFVVAASCAAGAVPDTQALTRGGPPIAACHSRIGEATGPTSRGRRLVLGRLSAPPVYIEQQPVALPAGSAWPYWAKVPLIVRSGTRKVAVLVPPALRSSVAITWGSARGGQVSVAFEACKDTRTRWYAYAGGFYLDSPSACVSLVVRIGERSRVVRTGIGVRCP